MRQLLPAAFVIVASCLEATQVKLLLTTDICELRHANIYLEDSTTPVASWDRKPGLQCADSLGSLVFVPSKRSDRFTVRVDGTVRPDGACTAIGCVHASRSVAFASHTSLELPINLERTCLDVSCPAQTTCRGGICVPDAVDCKINRMCMSSDGGTAEGGVADASTACKAPGSKLAMGTEIHHWSFEEADSQPATDSKKGVKVTLTNGFARKTIGNCGKGLMLGGGTDLPMTIMAPTVALSFELFVPGGQALPARLFVANTMGNFSGWDVGVDKTLTIGVTKGPSMLYVTKTPISPDVQHHVELFIDASGKLALVVDDMTKETLTTLVPPGNQSFYLAGSSGVVIDELGIFDGNAVN